MFFLSRCYCGRKVNLLQIGGESCSFGFFEELLLKLSGGKNMQRVVKMNLWRKYSGDAKVMNMVKQFGGEL